MSCGKYSVHTNMFSSFDVTSTRGLGSGHWNPVDVTFAPPSELSAGCVAWAPPPPQAVRTMLAMANTASHFHTFDLRISSSFRRLVYCGNAATHTAQYL